MKDSRAVVANRSMTVKREKDVSLLTQLTHKSFGLTALHIHRAHTQNATELKGFRRKVLFSTL